MKSILLNFKYTAKFWLDLLKEELYLLHSSDIARRINSMS